jgi:hypothetical protein
MDLGKTELNKVHLFVLLQGIFRGLNARMYNSRGNRKHGVSLIEQCSDHGLGNSKNHYILNHQCMMVQSRACLKQSLKHSVDQWALK